MNIQELLLEARKIWGNKKMSLEEIVIAHGVPTGDLYRYTRDKSERKAVNEEELKKELGNIIFSTIRWCDDLGFNPEECIMLAQQSQREYNLRK